MTRLVAVAEVYHQLVPRKLEIIALALMKM